MTIEVFIIVLVAAVLHPLWNAIMIRVKLEPIEKAALLNLIAALFGGILLIYTGWPSGGTNISIYLAASMIFNNGYFIGLMYAFRAGDMAQVYPAVRGAAVFLTTLVSTVFLHEQLNLFGWLGIVAVGTGVCLLSFSPNAAAPLNWRALGFALLTSAFLSAGLLVDGHGARASGNVYAYAGAAFLLTGVGTLVIVVIYSRPAVIFRMLNEWKRGVAGGFLSFLVSGIGIWAMTVASIPEVVALRDTSVLFGAAIAYLFLKETLGAVRLMAAVLIVCGVVVMRLGA
jgi:drug/metabolite transporter (DMT)-like permease